MAKKNIPEALDLDKLAQGPTFEPETESVEAAEATESTKREYKPSEKVLERLNKMPKDALKERFGIDIDELIKTEKRYGVLEALAYGDQTPRPIHIHIPVPGTYSIDTLATVRLKNAFIGKEGEPVIFMDNIHPTKLKYDVDENGVIKKDLKGNPKMVYDRNPIKEGDILKWGGKELTQEQTDRLRLTGNLGEPIAIVVKDTPTQVLLSVDPYNNHELIPADTNAVAKALQAKPEFKVKGADGETVTITLTGSQIGNLALGRNVWLGDKGNGGPYNVQYNAASRRLERTVDYAYAKRQERANKEKAALAKEMAKTLAESAKVGQHL